MSKFVDCSAFAEAVNRPYINILYVNSLWGTDSRQIAFGCSPNIRHTAECCLPRLRNTSTSNIRIVFACRIRILFAWLYNVQKWEKITLARFFSSRYAIFWVDSTFSCYYTLPITAPAYTPPPLCWWLKIIPNPPFSFIRKGTSLKRNKFDRSSRNLKFQEFASIKSDNLLFVKQESTFNFVFGNYNIFIYVFGCFFIFIIIIIFFFFLVNRFLLSWLYLLF